MKIQLMHVKNDVSIIKARNNTSCKESTETLLREIKETLLEMQNDIASIKENKMLSESRHTCTEVKKNCAELYKSGKTSSGVYTIDLDGHGAFSVFCDQTAAGGGWTVFQKRLDGSVDFYRGWTDYKNGFGNLHGEFWLGLDKIHVFFKIVFICFVNTRLIDRLFCSFANNCIAPWEKFPLLRKLYFFQENAGRFSFSSSWAALCNQGQGQISLCCDLQGSLVVRELPFLYLNGLYHHGAHSSYADGVNWYNWKGYHYSVKKAEMKIRPVQV
ncbi:microfibril-associated glycoprotein 4 [Pocillopora verrucosa]|uniref:microfibril-associated glycoprotein 4 n=1 Tax=Pocillopora verrucosa TaxID=203993 RepID=UPI003340531F